jgi:hypothetical protein
MKAHSKSENSRGGNLRATLAIVIGSGLLVAGAARPSGSSRSPVSALSRGSEHAGRDNNETC